MLILGAVFVAYAISVNREFKRGHIRNVRNNLMFESENINRTIDILEQNVTDLALVGKEYYLGRNFYQNSDGERLILDNFKNISEAVGGGIWFEKFTVRPNLERLCFYACRDKNGVLSLQSGFDGIQYNYPAQKWYRQISQQLKNCSEVGWSEVYQDQMGSETLMATVGAGIYDSTGKMVGMSTVDWEIQKLVDKLYAFKPTDGSEILLLDPRYSSVVADTSELAPDGKLSFRSRSIKDLPWLGNINDFSRNRMRVFYIRENGEQYICFGRELSNRMCLVAKVPEAELNEFIDHRNLAALEGGIIVTILVFFAVLYFVTVSINRPLQKLMSGVSAISRGKIDVELEVKGKDEIAQLSSTFNQMTSMLKQHIEQLSREMASKSLLENELKIASSIQRDLLPRNFPPFPNRKEFDLRSVMCPAKELGGDFYDFFMPDETHLAFLIADVSGKGIPAALFMTITHTLIRDFAEAGLSPDEVFRYANERLCAGNETGMFVTAWMAVLNVENGQMRCVNAGHNRPLVKRKNGRFEYLEMPPGFVLGGFPGMVFVEFTVQLFPGDRIFLYTDGVTEAMNKGGEFSGESRLSEWLDEAENLQISIDEYTSFLRKKIADFSDGAEQSDDITMLILEYSGPGEKTDHIHP